MCRAAVCVFVSDVICCTLRRVIRSAIQAAAALNTTCAGESMINLGHDYLHMLHSFKHSGLCDYCLSSAPCRRSAVPTLNRVAEHENTAGEQITT